MTLIPINYSPKEAGDYRPISLINFTMKILLKARANRISHALMQLFSKHQPAFVKNYHISDDILVANEVGHIILKRECMVTILNIEFAKAFDSVNWFFLGYNEEYEFL